MRSDTKVPIISQNEVLQDFPGGPRFRSFPLDFGPSPAGEGYPVASRGWVVNFVSLEMGDLEVLVQERRAIDVATWRRGYLAT